MRTRFYGYAIIWFMTHIWVMLSELRTTDFDYLDHFTQIQQILHKNNFVTVGLKTMWRLWRTKSLSDLLSHNIPIRPSADILLF